MKTTIYKSLVALSLSMSVIGCSEEFLEPSPVGLTPVDEFYDSEEKAYQGLVAAYDPLAWTRDFDGANNVFMSPFMIGEIPSDNANAGGGSPTDQEGWQKIDDFVADAETPEALAFWRRSYFGIYRANTVIALSDDIAPAEYKAEARFLRAYYYFELARIFKSVPIISEPTVSPDYTRPSVAELYKFITDDLTAAAASLPLTQSQKGRATKGAAQALLGKAYIYWADLEGDDASIFTQAITPLQEVYNSGVYSLTPNYADIFTLEGENNEESVFEIQYTEISGKGGWNHNDEGSLAIQLCGVRDLADHPQYLAGWGFCLPTQDLYDSFLEDDHVRRDAAIITAQELTDAGATFLGPEAYNALDYTGMWQKKYAIYKEFEGLPNEFNNRDGNCRIIRFAEVLLLLAEANIRGNGSDAEAERLMNEVRTRAGAGSVSDLRSALDGATLLEALWYERRAELALEGDRFFDLVRSDRANTVLGNLPNYDVLDQYLPVYITEQIATGLSAYAD